MSLNHITAELDAISNDLEKRGYSRLASRLDSVSNTIESGAKSRNRVAIDNSDLVPRGSKDERPPGSEETDEAAHEDSFEATNYHKVPIGNQSVSDAIGSSVADMLSDLDFAQATGGQEGHEINVQASKASSNKKASWPFSDLSPKDLARLAAKGDWANVARAAKIAQDVSKMEVDEGTEGDFSTADLEETGDEDANTPLDTDQTGDTLEFFGTVGPGDGPDSGHHGPTASTNLSSAAKWARSILRKAESEAPTVKDSPDSLHTSEDGEDVERDQELGGMTASRKTRPEPRKASEVDVYRPTFVPEHQREAWFGAAEYLGRKGRLMTASNKVDYEAVTHEYRRALKALADSAVVD